ncbi:Wzz/FepE/Etk N-terminal domain-containing protein [Serinicoccus sediminis]|uniref:Wzz/FepE/Etk N-terminal domain-containing protein n=1 Tax=Serinicoccus sediminis TaxID=2306021 RepID=UPI00102071ED|nr:Wzz/FepE/Etk N-terminal domain-containing protein [Serinicoccus sediminis]
MNENRGDGSVDLRHYVEVLWRKWWVIVLATLLGFGAGIATLVALPTQASATATVSLNLITSDPFDVSRPVSELIDPAGEAQVASSYAVAERAAVGLGQEWDASDIRRATEVAGVADTAVLRITATADSAEGARAIADASATAFLAYRSELAQSRIERRLEQSQARLAELRDDLREVNERLAQVESGSEAAVQAESDRSLINLEIDALASQLATARGIDTSGGTVLNPAAEGQVEYSPSASLLVGTATVAGLGIGLLLAFVLHAVRPRVVSRYDVSANGGGEVLGLIGRSNVRVAPLGEDLAVYREIRERLLAGGLLPDSRGLLAVLPTHAQGASSGVAVTLAHVLAQSGMRTTFVALRADDDEVTLVRDALNLQQADATESGSHYVSHEVPGFSLFVPRQHGDDEPFSAEARSEIAARRSDSLVVITVPQEYGRASRLAAARLADASVLLVARGASTAPELRQAAHDTVTQGGTIAGTVVVHRRRRPEVPGRISSRHRAVADEPVPVGSEA